MFRLYPGVTRPLGFRCCVAAAAGIVLAFVATSAGALTISAPGYMPTAAERLGPGVEHVRLDKRSGSRASVHVARISRTAPYDLRAVPANGAVGRGLERTSSMCKRTNCLLAVNGDFWNPATAGVPAGAVISLGQVLRAPSSNHFQLSWSPGAGIAAGRLSLHGNLVTSDLGAVPLRLLNVHLPRDGIVAYTRAWGPVTARGAFEIVMTKVRPPGRLTLSQTLLVKLTSASAAGGSAIPPNGLVLAGRGTGATQLKDLWTRVQNGTIDSEALVRVDSSPSAVESVGGSPVLLRDGRRVFEDANSSLVRNRHPRTIVGRTRAGDVLFVTVDGRQPGHSDGMTLAEAADLMRSLGAVDALNLDGGGSSTFVVKGKVANRPSDRAVVRNGQRRVAQTPGPGDKVVGLTERPVATSLQLVPRAPAAPPSRPGGMLQVLGKTQVQAPKAPYASDPGSDPTGTLPAIVVPVRAAREPLWPATAALVTLLAAVLTVTAYPRLRVRVELAR